MSLRIVQGMLLGVLLFSGCDSQSVPIPTPASPQSATTLPEQPAEVSWAEKRLETPLLLRRPPTQHIFVEEETPPEGYQAAYYPSHDSLGNELRLLAWVAMPDATPERPESDVSNAPAARFPAIVYFHSGHQLGAADCYEVQAFLDAGFAVMLPALRGENGNPGNFELFWGEVDDGLAAVRWFASQKQIDPDRIYTFGHSAGGGISAMLSLADADAPIRFGGSCGGLYGTNNLREWEPQPPFESEQEAAFELRTLTANAKRMKRLHYAYLGLSDVLCANAEGVVSDKLEIRFVLGDHLSSLPPARIDFCLKAFQDAFPGKSPPDFLQPLAWKHFEQPPTESVVAAHSLPAQWNVEVDPTPDALNFYRGPVRCDILMRSRRPGENTDFVFPRGFQPFAKYHALAGAPKPGVTTINLATMIGEPAPADVQFPELYRNAYSHEDAKYRPTGLEGMDDGNIRADVFANSPGGRYVAAFSTSCELLVWESATKKLVGCNPLPKSLFRDGQSEKTRRVLKLVELGFSPDGQEFAAVVGEPGNLYLINYHWTSGAITAFFSTVTPSERQNVQYPNRYQLQFLEEGRGWLVEHGRTIIDRKTGQRRGAITFEQLDPRYYRLDVASYTTPRAISGNRALVVMQNPANLFEQQIQTVKLSVSE